MKNSNMLSILLCRVLKVLCTLKSYVALSGSFYPFLSKQPIETLDIYTLLIKVLIFKVQPWQEENHESWIFSYFAVSFDSNRKVAIEHETN